MEKERDGKKNKKIFNEFINLNKFTNLLVKLNFIVN